ncbi:MAG: hypothetical protein Tsb0021_17500 [Chlamydiales bacterium]
MKHILPFFLLYLYVLFPICLPAEESNYLKELLSKGITIDLQDPEYSEGTLKTEEGGIIVGPDICIQAKKILYMRTENAEGETCDVIIAEGDLRIEYRCLVLVGQRITYNFTTREGTIENGRSGKDLWYFGGEIIRLRPDRNIEINNGYLTTSENVQQSWQIKMAQIHLDDNDYITARNIQFRFFETPLFWIPVLRTHLDWIRDNPIRLRIRWGGKQGLRFGMVYEVINWDVFKTFLRFDYRINRGPGGGIETDYRSLDGCERFRTINYIANDPSVEQPNLLTRYRLQGVYHNTIEPNRFTVDLVYDKLSDRYMARDYYDKGLDLKTACQTYLKVRRQYNQLMIGSLKTQVRINDFQTVNQELPILTATFHPCSIGNTGFIIEGYAQTGYLDFKYADNVEEVRDYHSGRIEARCRIYKNARFGPFCFTPEARWISIFYDNSPRNNSQWRNIEEIFQSSSSNHIPQWLNAGFFAGTISCFIQKTTPIYRHTLEPYTSYSFITRPSSLPNQHFIFDISDGIFDLNTLRYGIRNVWVVKGSNECFGQRVTADTYAYSFFETSTIPRSIPRIYTEISWEPFSNLRNMLNTAWDFERGIVDHFNFRTEWTIHPTAALAAEYRHRSAYSWRKSQYNNFILDSFLSEMTLRDSLVSDRRDTLIYHFFWRVNLSLAFQAKQRFGWGRENEPAYTESQVDMLTKLPSSWNFRVSYRHRENEHRVAFYFSLGCHMP